MHTHTYIYTQMCWVFFLHAFMKILGITASSFLCPLFRRFLGRCCGAHGLLAGLLAAVPRRTHSAASIVAKRLLRSWVLEATVLAAGVLAGLARLGSVFLVLFPERLGLLHSVTKVALARALCLASLAFAVPAGPLARVGAAFAVCCDLFLFFFHRFLFFSTPCPARGTGRELAGLAST